MATITETRVRIRLECFISDEDGQPRAYAYAESFDEAGRMVRSMRRNVTDRLSAARLTGITALLADVEAAVKQHWAIG